MDFYDVGERHYLHKFQEFQNSYALISPLSNVKCAIVFVHGFGGDSHGTWNEFPLMVDDFRPCASYYLDCDLFFFQYYSRSEWINASTSRFLNFIDEVVLKPDSPHFYERSSFVQLNQNIELRSEQRPDISVLSEPRHYEILVLVGHSEGGVVIRNAVLGRFKNSGLFSRFNYTRRLLLSAHLSLFAPAISFFVPKCLLGVISICPVI
jgi:pimeloyl-ACP methyl ester carboxylesterase